MPYGRSESPIQFVYDSYSHRHALKGVPYTRLV